MKTAFVIIATGKAYAEYATELIHSIREYARFDPSVFVFTDQVLALHTIADCFHTEPLGYPRQTLMRYHTILSKEHVFEKYDQLFYLDADMLFVNQVELNDIVSGGLTATRHPGFYARNQQGTPERRFVSTAYTPSNRYYYCGGFQGGDANAYLVAGKTMASRIDTDNERGVLATWHDESHWNRFLTEVQPARMLTPSFCYPEDYDGGYGWPANECLPILVARDKGKRGLAHPRAN